MTLVSGQGSILPFLAVYILGQMVDERMTYRCFKEYFLFSGWGNVAQVRHPRLPTRADTDCSARSVSGGARDSSMP